jgi:hypothetical protein
MAGTCGKALCVEVSCKEGVYGTGSWPGEEEVRTVCEKSGDWDCIDCQNK